MHIRHIHELNCMHIACANASHLTTVQWSNYQRERDIYILHLPSKGHLKCPLGPEVNKCTPLDLSLGNKNHAIHPKSAWKMEHVFFSTNSVATLRSSYGRCYSPVFNRGGIRRVWHFSFKFPHNMAVVKCPCAFRLRRLAPKRRQRRPGDASGIFPVNFHTKMALVRLPMEPSRRFGPASLSLWACHIALVAACSLDGQGDLAQRSWQGGYTELAQRSCTESSYSDLAQRS